MMTEQEATEKVRRIATEYDMHRYLVDGWSVWRLFSFSLALSLMDLPFSQAGGGRPNGLLQRWSAILRDSPAILFTRNANCVVKTFSSALTELENERYKDIYFDDFITEIGSCYKIETYVNPNFEKNSEKAFIPCDSNNVAIDYSSGFIAKLVGSQQILSIASEIASAIEQGFGKTPYSQRFIERCIRNFYWSKRLYKSLLRRISPKFVFVADTGEFALMAAAKELGIMFVEFQHGIMSRYHPHVLTEAELPYQESLLVPDRILLYGRHWKKELESQGFYGSELRVIGNIRIDRYRKRRQAFLAGRAPDTPVAVLVTTQGMHVQRIIAFIQECLDLAEGKVDILFTIKLHPMRETSKEPYQSVFGEDPRVRILSGSEDPTTFALLSETDLHVSIASACHYDSLGLGVPTVILPFSSSDVVMSLYHSGHASIAHTPNDLIVLAESSRNNHVSNEVSRYYFEMGARDNLMQALGIQK